MKSLQTVGSPVPGASVTVAYTGTAGTTEAVGGTSLVDDNIIRIVATTDCFIEIGLAPTAVANTGMYLCALVPEYFSCPASSKVSAIQVASGGSIYVTPMK